MRRLILAAGVLVLAFGTIVAAQPDHLEYLRTPQLVDCDPRPFFRVIVNAVDADRRPAGLAIDATNPTKAFQVFEGNRKHDVVYVSTRSTTAGAQGNYMMLLFDTSGSMNRKVASGETRFAAAKAAVKSSLAGFVEGVDHIAIVPFDSHDVAGRIGRAAFQTTRAGVEQQVDAMPVPRPNNNTAIFSAVQVALGILKQRSDAGADVSLVVFSDGENDVNRPGDDPGLLGDEGLAIVRDLANKVKVPLITVGFGVTGNAKAEQAFRGIAWPNAENYYDASTDASRLKEILESTRRKLTDQIQILFGPVRDTRSQLAGQTIAFRIQTTGASSIASRSEPTWNAPAVGVPLSDAKCTTAEARALTVTDGPPVPPHDWRIPILLGLSALLALLWFGAPRLMWPERYVPKPPILPHAAAPTMQAAARNRAPSMPAGYGQAARPRPPAASDQTIFIPPEGSSTRPTPKPPVRNREMEPREASDETIFIPPPKNPRGH